MGVRSVGCLLALGVAVRANVCLGQTTTTTTTTTVPKTESGVTKVLPADYVLLACALDQTDSDPEKWECDPKLDLLPRTSLSTEIRIRRGKIRVWVVRANCGGVLAAKEHNVIEDGAVVPLQGLDKRPECSYSFSAQNAAIPPISAVVRSIKMGDMSFDWMLAEEPHAKSVVISVDETADALGWDLGKPVVVSVERFKGSQAFSFIYGWWVNAYDEKLPGTKCVGLFFPTGLFAVGGEVGDVRVAAMPIGLGVGTKFLTWNSERYLGLGLFASYTVQAPSLRDADLSASEEAKAAAKDLKAAGIAFGALANLSGSVYLGYALVDDLSSSTKRWGHYVVVGSPLTELF